MEKQNLDILPGGILPVIHCSQGDIGRQFQINLYSDGAPYVLDGTEELTLDGHKEDDNIFTYSLDPVTGSTITISTEEQMTACAGNTICEIRIFKGTTRLGTCNFIMQVEEGPSNGTPSESTLQALDEIRAEVQQAVSDAEDYADAAKSWAVGPNGSGTGTDTNNSKYYSQQSSTSATSSANSATDSKNWAVGPSGSGSGTDSNNSKYYSQQSSNSASAASSSASDAKNWAVGPSGTGSGTDSNNAKYYATQAESAKTDAVDAKNDAVSAKNDAVSAKNDAQSSATDSKNWAVGPSGTGSGTDSNNSKYYSQQSSTSATASSNSATDSKNWAVGPSGSGSGTDSNNSKYYATQANNSATDANTAKTAAEAAQQKIENMTASASQLPEGSTPTVTKSEVGGVVNLAFGIPKGDTGATGPQGPQGPQGVGVPTIHDYDDDRVLIAKWYNGNPEAEWTGKGSLGNFVPDPAYGSDGQVLTNIGGYGYGWSDPKSGAKPVVNLNKAIPLQIPFSTKNVGYSSYYISNTNYVWTDGEHIYYNDYSYSLEFKDGSWVDKQWFYNGSIIDFFGSDIWTDGKNIYYSNDTDQYVLSSSDDGLWIHMYWNGLSSFYGSGIWKHNNNFYYSDGSDQYSLDLDSYTFTSTSWSGLSDFYGRYIWSDGINTYYGDAQGYNYILDEANLEWISVNTTNWDTSTIDARYIWSDGVNLYYSESGNTYIFSNNNWKYLTNTSIGYDSMDGNKIFTDGNNIYYMSSDNDIYRFTKYSDKSSSKAGLNIQKQYIPSGGTTGQVLAKASDADRDTHWIDASGGGGSSSKGLSLENPIRLKQPLDMVQITFDAANIDYPENIWTDGEHIYYNDDTYSLEFKNNTWINKEWSGLDDIGYILGRDIWKYDQRICYSNGTVQYELIDGVWTDIGGWSGLNEFYGRNMWVSPSGDIMYSDSVEGNYSLVYGVFDPVTFTGSLTTFEGRYIWTDGVNTYYSDGTATSYYLNASTLQWIATSWNISGVDRSYIWSDGFTIYYTPGSTYYKFTYGKWINCGSVSILFDGYDVFSDGQNIYRMSSGYVYKFMPDSECVSTRPNQEIQRQYMPVGGTAGQVLSKVDSVDYNTKWVDPSIPIYGNMTNIAGSYGDNQLIGTIYNNNVYRYINFELKKLYGTSDTTPANPQSVTLTIPTPVNYNTTAMDALLRVLECQVIVFDEVDGYAWNADNKDPMGNDSGIRYYFNTQYSSGPAGTGYFLKFYIKNEGSTYKKVRVNIVIKGEELT